VAAWLAIAGLRARPFERERDASFWLGAVFGASFATSAMGGP
jgi:hypothetical protein